MMATRGDEEFEYDVSNLPLDLWEMILLRLPVKVLFKFRWVYQSWRSLIDFPTFALRNITHNPENAKYRILTVQEADSCTEARCKIISCNDYSQIAEFQLYKWFDTENEYRDFDVVDYVKGVLCLKRCHIYDLRKILLSNPSIKKHICVPLPNMCNYDENGQFRVYANLCIGYDNLKNDVKLLAIGYPFCIEESRYHNFDDATTLIEVYGVGDRSWRSIYVDTKMQNCLSREWVSSQVFVNGVVHWPCYDDDENQRVYWVYTRVVAFDMEKEVFSHILLPSGGDKGEIISWRIPVVYEELFGVVEMIGTYFNLYVMKQYGIDDSWSRLYKIEIAVSLKMSDGAFLKIVGDVLYVKTSEQSEELFACNLRNRQSSFVADNHLRSFLIKFIDTYVESLLLLNDTTELI